MLLKLHNLQRTYRKLLNTKFLNPFCIIFKLACQKQGLISLLTVKGKAVQSKTVCENFKTTLCYKFEFEFFG